MEINLNSKLITNEEDIVLADTKPVSEQVLTKSTTLLTTEPISFGDNGSIAPRCVGEDNGGSNADFPTYEINLKTQVQKHVRFGAYFKFKANGTSVLPVGINNRYTIQILADYDVVAYLYKGSTLIEQEWNESTSFIMSARLEQNAIYELKVAFLNNNSGNITVTVDYSERPIVPNVPPLVTPKIESTQNIVAENTFADPVDVFTGAHTIKNDIMNLFGGQNITFSLNYNSSNLSCGNIGYGWYHNYEKKVCLPKDATNEDILNVYSNPSQFNEYTINSDGTYTCSSPGKNGYVLTVINGGYLLDCNKDHKEYYDTDGRLIKIVNHIGFETEIAYTDNCVTITDKVCNKSIFLELENNRIIKVYDDYGRYAKLSYLKDFLICICDLNNHSLFYTYDTNGRIQTGEDDNGTIYFANSYNSDGRVVTQHDSDNLHTTTFAYTEIEETEQNDSNNENAIEEDDKKVKYVRTTSNRNGDSSTRKYNSKDLLIEYTDENDDIKTYEYDANNNITKETDALGYSVEKSYNSFNKPITVKDKNGNITVYEYDVNGNVVKITYANGGVEEFKYNERNQITEHIDLRDAVTVYTYDDNGMPKSKKVCCKEAIEYVYENGLLKSEKDAMGNITEYHHDELGRMDYKTDPLGNKTYYRYDYFGNIKGITDAKNNSISYEYDCNYQKIEETDAKGNTTKYTYNGNLKLTSITTPDEYTEVREYDSEDRLILIRDKECRETKKTYDKAGRLESVCYPDGNTVSYAYIYKQPEETEQSEEMEKLIYVIRETSPTGAITEKTHDGNGNVISIKDDNGNVTQNIYDNMNRLVETINPMGGITVYRYSLAGDLLEKVDLLPNECEELGDGRKTTYRYDKYGNKKSVTDPNCNLTKYEYDHNNNLLKVKNYVFNENRTSETDSEFIELVTSYTYDKCNRVKSVTDANSHTVTYHYDKIGRRTGVTDAKTNSRVSEDYEAPPTFKTEYDANGNILNEKNADNHNLYSKIYNEMNLPIEVTDAAGKVTKYAYTPLGKVERVTDPLNNEKIYLYNSSGLNSRVIDENDGNSLALYNSLGQIRELTGPTSITTEYVYDKTGRLLSESTPMPDKAKSYQYNALNLKNKITNARDQEHTLAYNELGQLVHIITPEGLICYEYDNNGNVKKVIDKYGETTRKFDEFNRVKSVTDPFDNTIGYRYDAVGNLTEIVYPDNTSVTYTYDENNNLISVTDWANRETQYDYDQNNMLTTVTRPDGSITSIIYDTASRITSTSTSIQHNGTIVSGYSYVYDDLGRILTETDFLTDIQTSYVYDELSRVTKRTINGVEENFSYDAAGNIISDTRVYDTYGKLKQFDNYNVVYDYDGNMNFACIDGAFIDCRYDSSNRLISAGDYEYTYNAEDVRIQSECSNSNTVTHYVYDTNAKLSKLLVKNTDGVYTKYVYGNGLIGEETNGQFKTYHFDYRGSTIAITDSQGNVTDRFKYDTYGKVTEHTGNSDVIFKYNGRDGVITEPNGLYYMRARYYSPDLMRFINADILSGSISNAITLNRYAYANCNPVSNIDPFGLEAERGENSNKISAKLNELYDFLVKLPVEVHDYFIEFITGVSKEQHYSRNENNPIFPEYYNPAFFKGWDDGVSAYCHQFTSKNGDNKKYVSPDGVYEAIYDSTGRLVTAPEDVGTYNFASPKDDGVGHFKKDMLPWIFWGNSPDDSTSVEQRINSTIYGLGKDYVDPIINWITDNVTIPAANKVADFLIDFIDVFG